jgi:hypothetical protein
MSSAHMRLSNGRLSLNFSISGSVLPVKRPPHNLRSLPLAPAAAGAAGVVGVATWASEQTLAHQLMRVCLCVCVWGGGDASCIRAPPRCSTITRLFSANRKFPSPRPVPMVASLWHELWSDVERCLIRQAFVARAVRLARIQSPASDGCPSRQSAKASAPMRGTHATGQAAQCAMTSRRVFLRVDGAHA